MRIGIFFDLDGTLLNTLEDLTDATNYTLRHCGCPERSITEMRQIWLDSPLVLECRVTEVIPLGSHDMFLADIVAVDVNEELIDRDGKLHLDRANLAAYAHGEYFELGKKLGTFGFSVAKKKKHPQKNRK